MGLSFTGVAQSRIEVGSVNYCSDGDTKESFEDFTSQFNREEKLFGSTNTTFATAYAGKYSIIHYSNRPLSSGGVYYLAVHAPDLDAGTLYLLDKEGEVLDKSSSVESAGVYDYIAIKVKKGTSGPFYVALKSNSGTQCVGYGQFGRGK